MEQEVQRFMTDNQLVEKGNTVLVAVSGGADSMALLSLLADMGAEWSLTIYVVHVNHQLRGEESEKDCMFVQNWCRKRGVHFQDYRVDVNAQKQTEKVGTQAAAHTLRYQAFSTEMNRVSADVLATAHHGDDSTESVMKLNRGTTPYLRLGIAAKRDFEQGSLIRPLLCVTKEAILKYCNEKEILYRDDSSNESEGYTRNRFRKYVVPELKKENPLNHIHIRRFEEWQHDDNKVLMELAEDQLAKIVMVKEKDTVIIDKDRYLKLAIPLQRRVIHLILNCLYNKGIVRDFSSYIEQIELFLQSHSNFASIDLRNGLKVYRENNCYRFTQEVYVESDNYCLELNVPGMISTPLGMVGTELLPTIGEETVECMYIPVSSFSSPLFIRNRRPGDRFNPKGLNGSKKVNRVFIDRKIDLPRRHDWPLLVDSAGNILWILLLHKAELPKQQAFDHYVRIAFVGNT
ncbi:LOW QUALITY PROTEIN: tRNA(Ile)-lysidine synthetase [Bacillus sp. JCM 19047]|nr:LOW QUALITY PROTEIN: tRNA(Ile)-lysidine synthetase [Bacillus sp. JCM 19047]